MTNELWFDLDKSAREEVAGRFRQVSLEEWDLSARTKNALLRQDPGMSIGDVLCAGPEIAATRGLGRTTLQELHAKAIALLGDFGLTQMPVCMDVSQVDGKPEGQQLVLSQEVLGLSVDLLQFDRRTHYNLQRRGTNTIGGLMQITDADTKSTMRLDQRQLETINAAIRNVQESVSPDGRINWGRYYQLQGIRLVPSDLPEITTPTDIIRELPSAFKGVVLTEHDDRMWYIVQRRYGLQGTKKLTLNELGEAFGLTRERVRQIENKALGILQRSFVEQDFAGKNFRVHPAILQHAHVIAGIPAAEVDAILGESRLLLGIQAHYEDAAKRLWPEISLIFALSGFERVEFSASDLDPVWIRSGSLNVEALKRQMEELDRLLTVERTLALDELDVLRHLNARLAKKGAKKLSLAQLRQLKRVCSSIEERSDGLLWGRFESVKGRGNQVERLLFEAGEPLTMHEIARRLNHRLVKAGQRKVSVRNLGNQMSTDDRFVAVGRSGYWGLRAWPGVETGRVVDLMEQYLIELDRPATADEMYRYVSERRQVQDSSIGIYLSTNDKFRRMSQTTWGLASWPEAKNASVWNRAQVAGFLVQLFKDKKASELEYSEVKQALARAADISEEQAQAKLRSNRVLRTRKDIKNGQRIAFLRSESIQNLPSGRSGSASAKTTGRELIQAAVRRLLSAAPDYTMALRDLMTLVQKELGSKEKTVYAYIREMDDVERVMLPETRIMICRLKSSLEPIAHSQVLQIATPEVRAKVQRTLPYLTEDAVDVGLFLLSKEFEAILKDFMVAAVEIGKLSSTPGPDPSKWKLNNMVDVVAKEGLITDKSILHYLREERNARAHGSMPSLAERQLLMNNAPYLASLYIDYIRFFDDLRRTL